MEGEWDQKNQFKLPRQDLALISQTAVKPHMMSEVMLGRHDTDSHHGQQQQLGCHANSNWGNGGAPPDLENMIAGSVIHIVLML